jgi:hypothetical protein
VPLPIRAHNLRPPADCFCDRQRGNVAAGFPVRSTHGCVLVILFSFTGSLKHFIPVSQFEWLPNACPEIQLNSRNCLRASGHASLGFDDLDCIVWMHRKIPPPRTEQVVRARWASGESGCKVSFPSLHTFLLPGPLTVPVLASLSILRQSTLDRGKHSINAESILRTLTSCSLAGTLNQGYA